MVEDLETSCREYLEYVEKYAQLAVDAAMRSKGNEGREDEDEIEQSLLLILAYTDGSA